MKKSSFLVRFAAGITAAAIFCAPLGAVVYAEDEVQAEVYAETGYDYTTDPNYIAFVQYLKESNAAEREGELIYKVELTPSKYGVSPVINVDKYGNIVENGDDYFSTLPKAANDTYPSKYDARDYGYITSVKAQGEAGSCWAFSFAACSEASMIKEGIAKGDIDLSEAHMVWFVNRAGCGTDENDTVKGDGRQTDSPYTMGATPENAGYAAFAGRGVEKESYAPFYNAKANFDKMSFDDDEQRYITEYRLKNMYFYNANSVSDVKKGIMEHGALTLSYYSDDAQFNESKAAYYSTEKNSSAHAVTLVGWDDDFPKENFVTTPPNDGAWLVKNSWNNTWGDNGYFWMSYDTLKSDDRCVGVEYYDNKDVYDNIRQYTGAAAASGYYGSNGLSLSWANIFTSPNDETLKGVISYFVADATYSISVYKEPSAANPVSGTLLAKKLYIPERTGVYTLDMDELQFEKGDRYSVVITVDTSNNTGDFFYIFESKTEGSTYPGVSFFKYSNYSWQSQDNSGGNVYVKAVTVNGETADNELLAQYKEKLEPIYNTYKDISFKGISNTENYENNNQRGFMAAKAAAKDILENNRGSVTDVKNCIARLSYFGKKIGGNIVRISTAQELADLAERVNSGDNFAETSIFLTNDISLEGVDIEPIGTEESAFTGKFYGGGHKIKLSGKSLFGYAENATINNVVTEGTVLSDGTDYLGAIVKKAWNSSIVLCVNNAEVNNKGNKYAGGIAGSLVDCTTDDCENTGNVTADDYAGGVVGCMFFSYYNSVLQTAKNSGNVSASVAGGIIGFSDRSDGGNGVFYLSGENSGSISGNYAGGIVGDSSYSINFEECSNKGSITGAGAAAGILCRSSSGYMQNFVNCINSGKITADRGVAYGITGQVSNIAAVLNTGEISGYYKFAVQYETTSGSVTDAYNTAAGLNNSARVTPMDAALLETGEAAYILDTISADGTRRLAWSVDENGFPIFTDMTNNPVYKLTLYMGSKTQNLYIKAESMLDAVLKNAAKQYFNCGNKIKAYTDAALTAEYTNTYMPSGDTVLYLKDTGLPAVTYNDTGFGDDGSYQPAVYNNGVYEISNAGQLFWYAEYINGGNSADAKLTADITINSGASQSDKQWVPIEADNVVFDGDDHFISGISCSNRENAGLFASIKGGEIKNVSIRNSYFSGTKNAGAIAAASSADIISCSSVSNSITGGNVSGGIAGSVSGAGISNSFAAKSEVMSGSDAGFICGDLENGRLNGCGCAAVDIKSSAGNTPVVYGGMTERVMGDVDINGVRDMFDAIYLRKMTYKTNDFASVLADFDENAEIDDKDAAELLKMIAKS
ncbi:MAG: hypothetical protein J6A07_07370 [Firmicutes bacterium]|nr:hypothetical protein [Bacillota bacterium]